MKYFSKNSEKTLKCVLLDYKNAREICSFEAADISVQNFNFDYVSGIIASSGQGRTIITDHKFSFDVRKLVQMKVQINEIKRNVVAGEYVIDSIGYWDDVRAGKNYGSPVRHIVLNLV